MEKPMCGFLLVSIFNYFELLYSLNMVFKYMFVNNIQVGTKTTGLKLT